MRRGLWIRLEYDYHDPDIDTKDGAENMAILGVEVFPTGFLELIANLRVRERTEDEAAVTEGEVQAHIFY